MTIMKTLTAIIVSLCLLVPLNIQAGELKFGEPLTLDTVTPVSEINNNPTKYIGQRVLIEGLVTIFLLNWLRYSGRQESS